MDGPETEEYLRDSALELDHEQFEVLCKMVIERAEQTQDLELTPFRADDGIDIQAIIDRDLFHARLGVQVKQYARGNTIGPRRIQRFKGALFDGDHHIGTYITTSTFTSGAEESAERSYIRLIDGERLARIMHQSEIGVVQIDDGTYDPEPAFWAVFETPETDDTIPSQEVPQADTFAVIDHVLRAIDSGQDIKPEITAAMEQATGDAYDPRQADYYGMAAWLLGFVHKDERVEVDGHEVRRWGLTRDGEEYLAYRDRGDDDAARGRLHEAIRDVEIISRVLEALTAAGTVERQEIAEIVAAETEVSGSTVPRRALSIGKWLAELPEIETAGSGESRQFRYRRGDLSDNPNQ